MQNPIKKTTLSQEAYDQYTHTLVTLKQELKAVMQRLQTAREMGDLSENGAYKYAKFELGDIRRKIRDISRILAESRVLKQKDKYNQVEVGCTVELADDHSTSVFTIVGEYETNPLANKISLQGPLGIAINNKQVGDQVTVVTPSGTKRYQIKRIS